MRYRGLVRMKNKSLTCNVPELRFPEFKNEPEWEEKSLSKLLTIGNGRDYKHLSNGKVPVYGTGGYMLSVNDYLYDGESVCIGRKGTIDKPMFLTGKFWTVDTLFYTHSFKHCIPKYIYYNFGTINWYNYNEAGGVPSLSKTTINKINIPVPPKDDLREQQKIADCLSSIDNLITAQSKKVEALKEHKKGLMQQLFPQDDEEVPKLRFPEFKNTPKWEEKILDNICDFQDGFAFSSSDFVQARNKAMQVIRITDINNKNTNNDKIYFPILLIEEFNLNKYIVQRGDLLLSLTGAAGFNFFSWDSEKALINQRTMKIMPKGESNKSLLKLLEPLIYDKINIHGVGQNNNLSKEVLKKVSFLLPKIEEQKKIADFLSSIDEIITSSTKKVEALKEHKKALMQQLFPSAKES